MNKTIVSAYGGSSIAICAEGEEDYVEKVFNGLLNHGASSSVCKHFNFRYIVSTNSKLERAFFREGETLCLTRLWREFRESGRTIASATESEEVDMMAKAAEFGAQYAAEKLNQVERHNFMEVLVREKNATFQSVEY